MPRIELYTEIKPDIKIVLNLARSINLHKLSTKYTNETAIAGKTSGLIGLNESVTWRARHFGFYQILTSKIIELNQPSYFADEMVSGAFKSFKHEHHFTAQNGTTLMADYFDYRSPFGILGKLADRLFLEKYMTALIRDNINFFKKG